MNAPAASSLFDGFDIGTLRLPNRIVMAPMTRSRVGTDDELGELNARYYAQRASAGLIISEAIVVGPMGRGYLYTPGLYTGAQIEGCRKVVRAVHDSGGRIFAQLWHVGRVSNCSLLPGQVAPVGPTSDPADGLFVFAPDSDGKPGKVATSSPRAMTDAEVDGIAALFATAARNAMVADFDGFEILAGNGYLFEQFQNSAVNTRAGRYGGDTVEGRTRLVLNTIDAMRTRLGPAALIGVRISPFGRFNAIPEDIHTEETYIHLAQQLEKRGVAYVHFNDEPVSIGHLNEDFVENTAGGTQRLIPASFLREFRRHFHGPVMLCGGLDGSLAEAMLHEGLADLFAFGLKFIANPDLPRRLRDGLTLAEADTELFYGGDERGYSDYPACAD